LSYSAFELLSEKCLLRSTFVRKIAFLLFPQKKFTRISEKARRCVLKNIEPNERGANVMITIFGDYLWNNRQLS
jgi:hypothetical protein